MNRLENWFCSSAYWRRITARRLLPWLLEGAQLGDDVLEIGAGPGAATGELAKRVTRVTSLEYSHRFCIALHSNNDAANVVQGDGSALPFAAGAFTSVIAVLVLHHLRSTGAQDQAFAEIFRVLKPGGVFAALEVPDGWLTRAVHIRSTFVPVFPRGVAERIVAAGGSKVSIKSRPGAFRVRAERAGTV